jgi:hydrogenase maturation protease
MAKSEILILGIGNYLLGDEGVGVHAIQQLEREKLPPFVTVVDGGTGGFHLLSYFSDYETIVMIDATMDGQPAGSIRVIEPRFASDFPRALSAHDIGLRDLIESAALLGPLPKCYLVTISIAEPQSLRTELSPTVAESLPRITQLVHSLLNSITGVTTSRVIV